MRAIVRNRYEGRQGSDDDVGDQHHVMYLHGDWRKRLRFL